MSETICKECGEPIVNSVPGQETHNTCCVNYLAKTGVLPSAAEKTTNAQLQKALEEAKGWQLGVEEYTKTNRTLVQENERLKDSLAVRNKACEILKADRDAAVADKGCLGLIAAERIRQVEKEGWTSGHDDSHLNGELSSAAAAYALASEKPYFSATLWPWRKENGGGYHVLEGFKPSADDSIRDLVKAGSLIVAEIERLMRKKDAAIDAARTQTKEGK